MRLKMEKKLIDRAFIPTEIVRGWSDDGEKIKYLNLDEIEVEMECELDNLFFESFLLNCNAPEKERGDGLFNLISDTIRKLKEGDTTTIENEKEHWAFLLASQYYLYRYSPGSLDLYRKRNSDKIRKAESRDVLIKMAAEECKRPRRLTERFQAEFFSIASGTYLWDLKSTLLYAPETHSFALGEAPLAVMNFFCTSEKLFSPFLYHGVVLILPVTPKMAVCLYDDSVYKVKKRKGMAVLSDEDVDVINTFIAECSVKMLFSRNEKNDASYIRSLLEDKTKIEGVADYNISVFNILASSVVIESGSLREYPETMMLYDETHSLDEDYYLEKRIDYAFELLNELGEEGVLV